MNDFHNELGEISFLYETGDFEKAVNKAQLLLDKNPNDHNAWSYSAGFFIDIGNVLQNLELVEKGVSLIEKIFKEQPNLDIEIRSGLEYNLSNGYASKHRIFRIIGEADKSQEALRREKYLLQNLLLNKNDIERDLLKRVMANYGNSLDHAGRAIEAIDQYKDCLDLFPDHAVAKANCGIAIKYIINSSEKHSTKNLHEAWSLLSSSLQDEAGILSLAGTTAIEYFQAHLADLEELINHSFEKGLDELQNWSIHRDTVHGHPKASPWLEKINRDRLLLTLNQNPLNSKEECIDDIFFNNLVTNIGDTGQARFIKLANTVNNIKEDFVTARYFFYESQKREKLAEQGHITHYGDGLDHAQFGLASGISKASFRLAADCLDKISVLLNEYFELGHEEKYVNFNNFWYVDRKHNLGIHPTLQQAIESNKFIFALRDLQQDWFIQKFPAPLKSTRDAATHRRLVLYWMKPFDEEQENMPNYEFGDFQEVTFMLLRMVKAAIVYALAAITEAEKNKGAEQGLIVPLTFDFGSSWDEKEGF